MYTAQKILLGINGTVLCFFSVPILGSNPDPCIPELIIHKDLFFKIFSVGMGMTMSGLNPNGFPQPQSIAPAPAMGIMAMMAAAAPQPAALSMGAAAQALPVVDTVPAGNSSLESGGGGGGGGGRQR